MKILVRNTADHPAMRIPPGGTGEVDELIAQGAPYLVPVRVERAPRVEAPTVAAAQETVEAVPGDEPEQAEPEQAAPAEPTAPRSKRSKRGR